jgi:hypothetical protein
METHGAAAAWVKSGRPYSLFMQGDTRGLRIGVRHADEEGHDCFHLSRRIDRPTMRECGQAAVRWLGRLGVAAEKAAAFATKNFGLKQEEVAARCGPPPVMPAPEAGSPSGGGDAAEGVACTNVLEQGGHGVELVILSATASVEMEMEVVLAAEEKFQAGQFYAGTPPVVLVGLADTSPGVLAWFRRHGREMVRHR